MQWMVHSSCEMSTGPNLVPGRHCQHKRVAGMGWGHPHTGPGGLGSLGGWLWKSLYWCYLRL